MDSDDIEMSPLLSQTESSVKKKLDLYAALYSRLHSGFSDNISTELDRKVFMEDESMAVEECLLDNDVVIVGESSRPQQVEVVEAALSKRDCLVVMPTVSGKSACFLLPGLIEHGVTIALFYVREEPVIHGETKSMYPISKPRTEPENVAESRLPIVDEEVLPSCNVHREMSRDTTSIGK
ncbi:hypothetical protein DAPPUDRAFT_262219 [Daphnia pulex]|uniref:DEAD/DEAH-box helicase domain-containing protein n=1 Tax=Daphnia pulex TaxID=6669 RepID=E9HMK8_DAPPU|nr:hypothetical protein DAPPUDRAFT_262219 [Daphnia pulex]|eukprot:EFX66984.1 hypothetical protein DAPPUDRAFT_262219 [Daphnia pulex]